MEKGRKNTDHIVCFDFQIYNGIMAAKYFKNQKTLHYKLAVFGGLKENGLP